MEQVAFFAGAIGALGGAIAVILLRNPFYSVLALVVHLFSLAGLFLLLHAEFVAAAQVVVYAGAVMVLYVFVAAYVGGFEEPLWDAIPGQRILAPLIAAALFIELSIAILGTGLKSLASDGAEIPLGWGSPESIGKLLLERFLIPFEAASLLLLIAAVGAVVLAARRPALPTSGGSGPGTGDRTADLPPSNVPPDERRTPLTGSEDEVPADHLEAPRSNAMAGEGRESTDTQTRGGKTPETEQTPGRVSEGDPLPSPATPSQGGAA